MGAALPVIQPTDSSGGPLRPRPVDADWKCCRSGECCTKPAAVTMTVEEQQVVMAHALNPDVLKFKPLEGEEGFVQLQAAPCPLYLFGECSIYEHRPFNCRRFACLRPDPASEPWEENSQGMNLNLMERVASSRVALRLAQKIQRKAQRWAIKHGWRVE